MICRGIDSLHQPDKCKTATSVKHRGRNFAMAASCTRRCARFSCLYGVKD